MRNLENSFKIGILDADLMDNGTRHPNLALMKIAGYYRSKGAEVELIFNDYNKVTDFDKVFVSKVFTFTYLPDWILELDYVEYGGTGFYEDGGENLPYEIEHHMPYYDLYKEYVEKQLIKGSNRNKYSDYLDYSIGFATRGCFRKCSFCVNKKYDKVSLHSPIREFFDESRPYIYLWDDNILAYKNWRDIIDELEKIGRPFQFRQGIDLRLMNNEKAKKFNNTNYHGDFIFAFDHLNEKEIIVEKVQLWKRYSSRVCKMYVLCAYESQDHHDIENIFKRISILMKYGSIPYVMRYEDYKESKFRGMYVELARWCNQPQFFKKKSFREFCIANQEYKKNKDTNCAAYQTMIDFERDFPDISAKYFDLKFEEKNRYKLQYGYGRKYENKPECNWCENNGLCWRFYLEGSLSERDVIKLYFTKEMDLQCMTYENSKCKAYLDLVTQYLIDIILKYDINDIIQIIKESDNLESVTKENIPQYSKLDDAFFKVNNVLVNCDDVMNFEDIGYYLEKDKNVEDIDKVALKKYGENHAKLAALLDLAVVGKVGNKSNIYLSELGKKFYYLSNNEKQDLAYKLCLRIPIIQNRLIESVENDTIIRDMQILSKETLKRRRSNVINMIRSIVERSDELSSKYN